MRGVDTGEPNQKSKKTIKQENKTNQPRRLPMAFDDPKPEDSLSTTVGDWNEHGRVMFNAGIDACMDLIHTQGNNLVSMDNRRRRSLIERLQKLKRAKKK